MGGPSLSALVCPCPAGAVPPVGADGAGRLAVGGVAVQMWGGSVIFGSVTVGLGRLCRGGTCPVRACDTFGARLWEGRCTTSWLFCWLLCDITIFEKVRLPVGTAGLNRRPLDPQSRSGRRWTSPGIALWALDQARQSPGVAGRRLMSASLALGMALSRGGRPTTDRTAERL